MEWLVDDFLLQQGGEKGIILRYIRGKYLLQNWITLWCLFLIIPMNTKYHWHKYFLGIHMWHCYIFFLVSLMSKLFCISEQTLTDMGDYPETILSPCENPPVSQIGIYYVPIQLEIKNCCPYTSKCCPLLGFAYIDDSFSVYCCFNVLWISWVGCGQSIGWRTMSSMSIPFHIALKTCPAGQKSWVRMEELRPE